MNKININIPANLSAVSSGERLYLTAKDRIGWTDNDTTINFAISDFPSCNKNEYHYVYAIQLLHIYLSCSKLCQNRSISSLSKICFIPSNITVVDKTLNKQQH